MKYIITITVILSLAAYDSSCMEMQKVQMVTDMRQLEQFSDQLVIYRTGSELLTENQASLSNSDDTSVAYYGYIPKAETGPRHLITFLIGFADGHMKYELTASLLSNAKLKMRVADASERKTLLGLINCGKVYVNREYGRRIREIIKQEETTTSSSS